MCSIFNNERLYIANNYRENDLLLTEHQQDLLTGTLLGDGNLQTSSLTGETWRYRAIQKKDHHDYLLQKYNILKNICGSPPIYSKVYDSRTEKHYERWYFNSLTFAGLNPLARAFYVIGPSGRWIKDVPTNIAEILTPRAVAYWYMDDGSLKYYGKSNAMRICSESFSKQGVEILQAAMWDKFNISVALTKRKKKGVLVGYRLAIHEAESSKFRDLIQPYLIPSMKYKVSNGKYGRLSEEDP